MTYLIKGVIIKIETLAIVLIVKQRIYRRSCGYKEKKMKKVFVVFLCVLLAVGGVFAAEFETSVHVGPQFNKDGLVEGLFSDGSGDSGVNFVWTFDKEDYNLSTGLNLNLQDFVALEICALGGISKDFPVTEEYGIRTGLMAAVGTSIFGTFDYNLGAGISWRPMAKSGPVSGIEFRVRSLSAGTILPYFVEFSVPITVGWRF